jgi:hypothetical protein
MKKIYIVTSGYYSDYGINAVFSTKELAEKYINNFDKTEQYPYGDFNIEEWELNPNKEHLKQNRKYYFVRMEKNGDIKEIEEGGGNGETIQNSEISFTYDKTLMNVFCYADSKEHAVKIAGERRTYILFNDLWGKETMKF